MNSFTRCISFLLLLMLLFSGAVVSKAEVKYEVSEEDLVKIIQISNRLQVLNQQLTQSLEESNIKMEAAKAKLAEFQAELNGLTQKLLDVSASSENLKKELTEARELLEQNNQNLSKYQKKVETQIRSLKLQRNIAAVAAVLILLFK